MSGCLLSNVVMAFPSLDCIPNADPPTPTDSTTSKAPLDGDQIPYDELLSKYTALESSNASLQSSVVTLQGQNDYWTKLYTYIEQGLSLKIAELNTLRVENQQLKVSDHGKYLLMVGNKSPTHNSVGRSSRYNSDPSVTSKCNQTDATITRSSSCKRFSH
jgi:hypothetical protein